VPQNYPSGFYQPAETGRCRPGACAVKSDLNPHKEAAMESSLRLVAITNCPAGIAHTYMVAGAGAKSALARPYD
jgi:hypothetical protein